MIENLNNHYSFTNPASVYDEESLTALQLAARTCAKVKECVREVNEIDNKIIEHSNNLLRNGTFDEQIDKHTEELTNEIRTTTSELTERVDNLILNAGGNSEPEVIDARIGYDKTYTTLGEALRKQFEKSLKRIDDVNEFDDLSDVDEMGVVYVSASKGWGGLPEGEQGGFLITLTSTYVVGRVQVFIGYTENVYFRKYLSDRFGEWRKLLTDGEILALRNLEIENGGEFDFDTLTDTGVYRVSSSYEHNAPEDAGVLIVFGTGVATQCYQMFIGYFGGMYYRGLNSAGKFNEWENVKNTNIPTPEATTGKRYIIELESPESMFIHQKGKKGTIRFRFSRDADSSIELNTYRLGGIFLIPYDTSEDDEIPVCEDGVDLEGVFQLPNLGHIGGVHGYETYKSMSVYIDGKYTLIGNITDGTECDHIVIGVESQIFVNDDLGKIYRQKRITFDENGVEVSNEWVPEYDLDVLSVRASMMSVHKNIFTYYYDNHSLPRMRADDTTSQSTLTLGPSSEINYIGENVRVKHTVNELGGSPSKHSAFIQDYGGRFKSYFTCCNNETLTADEPIYATGRISIDY